MSTDFALTCPCGTHQQALEEGGTYTIGGTHKTELNVTYNYAPLGLSRSLLEGKTGKDTVGPLRDLVDRHGTKQDDDYWAATPGNVGHAAQILLRFAEAHPDSVWTAF